MSSVFLFSSCLKEDPPFNYEDVIVNTEGLQAATNGNFSRLASEDVYGLNFFGLANLNSGVIVSGSVRDQQSVSILNTPSNYQYNEKTWQGLYSVINGVNSILDRWASKEDLSDIEKNELAQNYFLRAFSYFNLVRLWGEVPLRLATVDGEKLHSGREKRSVIYAQIIKDAEKAVELYKESDDVHPIGKPNVYATKMLLAKVYMTLPYAEHNYGNGQDETLLADLNITADDCFNTASDALDIIINSGKYDLISNYEDLWQEGNSNTIESIFELQYNVENPFNGRPWNISHSYKGGAGWSRMNISPEIVDEFVYENTNHEPYDKQKGTIKINSGDPRFASIFTTSYYKNYGVTGNPDPRKNQILQEVYPDKKIGNNAKTFPHLKKYMIKNLEQTTASTNQNTIIYRYAEVLLMKAEVLAELGDFAGAVPYINQVIERARKSTPAEYETGGTIVNDGVYPKNLEIADLTSANFKEVIQRQYRYELLGEGGDWFRLRKYGYDWFKTNVIDYHNLPQTRTEMDGTTTTEFDHRPANKVFNVVLLEDEGKSMILPVPQSEINTNQKISNADQNMGYK